MAASGIPGIPANSPLLNPGATLSGPALVQAAKGLASAQVSPAIQQLVAEIAQNNNQTQGAENLTGNYFNQLGQQAQQGLTAQQGISNNLTNALQGIQSNENSQLQGIGQNALANFQKYAPQSDAANTLGASGMSALTSEIARQQGLAAQNNAALSNFGANQNANYQNLAASNLGSFASRGQEDLSNIAQAGQVKNEPLTQKLATENATYGADVATALGKLRQQEITNQISDAGLGIKQQTVNASIANNERNNATSTANNQRTTATSAANNQRTVAQSNLNNQRTTQTSAANNAANNAVRLEIQNEKTGAGATKPLTVPQQNTIYRNLDEMTTLIRQAQQAGHPAQAIKTALATGTLQKGLPAQSSTLIEAAYELLGWGHITPQTATAMHNAGLRGGTWNNKPIVVAPPPAPAPPVGGNNVIGNLGNTIGNTIGNIG